VTALRPDRTEGLVQVAIFLLIGGMAGAASFTHVHDWTMANVPAGTGNWFGWANAVISELTPTAAGLEIRRRKRQHPPRPITYPLAVLVAFAALSLSAQVAQATRSPTGWLLAAVPALAFLALSKLVLSRPGNPASPAGQPDPKTVIPDPAPALPAPAAEPIPADLLAGARMAAFTHRQATGHDITADTLASHLAIPRDLADTLHHALGDTGTAGTTPPLVTHANGTGPDRSRP
jgi:hypothetical protein